MTSRAEQAGHALLAGGCAWPRPSPARVVASPARSRTRPQLELVRAGYVTYSNEAKVQDLGVDHEVLARHGAVSAAVVEQMAIGALRASGADLAVASAASRDPMRHARQAGGLVFFAVLRRGVRRKSRSTLPGRSRAVRGAAWTGPAADRRGRTD